MKKTVLTVAVAMLAAASLFASGQKDGAAAASGSSYKVGMVTDSGTIDDKSFNQGTWEGILRAGKDFGVQTKYLKPAGSTEADYIKEIGNLADAGGLRS